MTTKKRNYIYDTGWKNVDRLFTETDIAIQEFNEVKMLIEQSYSSFQPRIPFGLKEERMVRKAVLKK